MSSTKSKKPPKPELFLPLPENRVAYEAMSRLGEDWLQGESEGTVFISGPAGCGKSHLVRFGVKSFQQRNPDARAEILTAAGFSAQLAEASSLQTIPLFQSAMREYDLLVIEDLQVLQGRPESLTQLLHLVIALRDKGAGIVWTAVCPPGSLAGFPPRLISRFRGGITARIKALEAESRLKLLCALALGRQLSIPEEALIAVANAMPVSARELGGVIQRLESMSRQYRRPIDAELVRRYLEKEALVPNLTLMEIAKEVAGEFGLKLADLRSNRRTRQFAFPRQVGMWLSRQLLGESLQKVGKFYGGRDHTTVVHACQRVTEQAENDAELQSRIERIRQRLKSEH